MNGLLFGVAGVPEGAKGKSSEAGVDRVRELGLDAMELAWVRGVRMGEEAARSLGRHAEARGVVLTAHAAYYINLNSDTEEKRAKSRNYILQAARVGALCGVRSVVFHAASYMGRDPEDVYRTVKEQLEEVVEVLREEGNPVKLRPETTGKPSQFGCLDEVLRLCSEVEDLAPCIDFAHLHARTGGLNSYEEFAEVLRKLGDVLGRGALEDLHIHLSGISYSSKGEKKHLMLPESDMNYRDLLRALCEFGAEGVVISESPDQAADALLLKRTYEEICGSG